MRFLTILTLVVSAACMARRNHKFAESRKKKVKIVRKLPTEKSPSQRGLLIGANNVCKKSSKEFR